MKKKDYLQAGIDNLLFVIGFAALVLTVAAVFLRSVGIPLSWSDELIRALVLWLYFLGCASAFADKDLINVSLLEEALSSLKSKIPYKVLKTLQYVVLIVYCVLGTSYGMGIVTSNFALNKQTALLHIPSGLINLCYPAGMILLAYYGILKLYTLYKRADVETV